MGSNEELKSGLVISLAFSGIKNVIGMRESIYDKAGIVFAQNFIEEVANKKTVAQAVQKARHEISRLEDEVKEHWHLPILVSQDVNRPLVDWEFTPISPSYENFGKSLNNIVYPTTFIGRRYEFREFYNYLYDNQLDKILLYGEGGMGKTAVIAKFGSELKNEGYKVFDYSLKHGDDYEEFLFDMDLDLNIENTAKYEKILKKYQQEDKYKIKRLAELLLLQHNKVAFIFDNLESVQNPQTKKLEDENLNLWLEVLNEIDNVVLLMSSRWVLPNCKKAIQLGRPLKSDYLYFLSIKN